MDSVSKGRVISAALLISGCCVGVGMFAMPVATYQAGFVGSLPTFFAVWLFANLVSRLVVEACLWCPKGANLITISRVLLGTRGAVFCWILYLFLFYCLMTAQIAGGGQVIAGFIYGGAWPDWISRTIYVLLLAPAIYFGAKCVARLNAFFMGGLVLAFLALVALAADRVRLDLLARFDFGSAWNALPILLTAFGFQNLIPTLLEYLNRNARLLNRAIWIGTTIPLIFYLVWQGLVLGIVPPEMLAQALADGENAVMPLRASLHRVGVRRIANGFAFFAFATTFISMGIAFTDFWADALSWKKNGMKRIWLLLLVFGLPFIAASVDPGIFFHALDLAGGVGVSLFIGLLPLFLVWSGRYIQKLPRIPEGFPGGKLSLAALFLFTLFVIYRTFP